MVRVAAVMVNHNTSAYAELALRSLFVQNPGVDLALTVYDNDSTDDQSGLLAAAAQHRVSVVQSGFTTDTLGNSHGDVLRRFVLDPAGHAAELLLFLDADVCFTRPGTLATLAGALAADAQLFGVGPRLSWDGQTALPADVEANPSLYRNRLHPCCALVANTTLFRSVAEHLGLSGARLLHADHAEQLDTFELMTRAMRTHGLRHLVVHDALVMHAFAVSYPDESSTLLPEKHARRDHWLNLTRARDID